MTTSEKEALIARHEALAPDDSEIDTTDIPVSESDSPHWIAKGNAVVAPVAEWCFRKGYQKGYDAAMKEVQDALAALVAAQKQGETVSSFAQQLEGEAVLASVFA